MDAPTKSQLQPKRTAGVNLERPRRKVGDQLSMKKTFYEKTLSRVVFYIRKFSTKTIGQWNRWLLKDYNWRKRLKFDQRDVLMSFISYELDRLESPKLSKGLSISTSTALPFFLVFGSKQFYNRQKVFKIL